MIRSAMKAKPYRRKCAICKTPVVTTDLRVKWCSVEHGATYAAQLLDKKKQQAKRAEHKADKEKLKTLHPQKKRNARLRAKEAMHAYIRARDEGKSCISCDTILLKLGRVGGDYDAGHFRAVGSAKHLEFVEANINGQCKHCNDYLAGNRDGYERGLIERFGQAHVDALKNDNTPRHLGIDDYERIAATYRQKLKDLQAAQTALAA